MDSPIKRSLDWNEIHRRMDAMKRMIDQGWEQPLDDKKALLRERAQTLAREASRKQQGVETLEVLEFLLAYEHYGIELKYVREVYPLRDLTPLPGTPPFILGVTNVRGQVLSIIDMKKLFGLPDRGLADFNKIIILHTASMEIGLLADSMVGLESIPVSEIQTSLPTLNGIREAFLRGVTRHSMVVLDAEKLLAVRQEGWHGTGGSM
jgi:purine-binding chemotaxis protein CheW